jgi:hypothetical protein
MTRSIPSIPSIPSIAKITRTSGLSNRRRPAIPIGFRRIPDSIAAIDGRSLRGGPVFGHLVDRLIASIASAVAGEPTAAAR